jgi:small subunit ribosomal protein S1
MANEDKKVSEETENTQAAAESKPAETQEKVTESTEKTAEAEEPKAEVAEKTPKTEAAPATEEEAEETTAEAPTEDTDADPDGNDIVTRQKEEEVGRDDEDGDELNLYEGREEFDPANFDWEKFEHGAEDYNETERASLDEMYDDTLNAVQQGEVVKGSVVDITKKEVVVNINYKSEGIVTANEFRYNEDLKIGDTVDVYVESLEDKNGQLDISHKTARMHEAWRKVNAALEDDTIITGNIKCRTKGGLIADVFGLEAFLPGSQIDVKPIRDYDMYVGKKMEFKVVKINHEFKNVVVSHKALIEAELEEQKKQIIGGLEKGQVLEGTVKNITSYGVFIDLGGVDGLIHITDLSWGRINHPEEVVELDQKINVVILDFDDDKKRIALGLKQLTDHPWDTISDEVQVGSKVKGKVVVIADYGAFVEIAPGVEGLVHVSEMSWSQHLRSAQDFLNVGDEIDTVVLSIDREERKMSLGIKQLMPDPWASIVEKYPVGSKHKASVRNFTNFGIFVELEEGIDGLVHISDLSWSKKIKHPSEFCNVGDEMEVVVLEVDQDNRRLSLGHKQLEENPWDVFESVFLEGSTHEGTVTSIENNTATIAMPYGVEAVAPAKHLLKADGSSIKVDERAEFVVLEFNKNQRRIMVSHTRTFEEDPKLNKAKEAAERKASSKAASKAVQNIQKGQEKTTLGDLDVLAGLKNEMEKDEKAATAKAAKKSKEDKEEES